MAVTLVDIQTAAAAVVPGARVLDNVTTEFAQGVWFDMQGCSWTMNMNKSTLNVVDLQPLIRAAFKR